MFRMLRDEVDIRYMQFERRSVSIFPPMSKAEQRKIVLSPVFCKCSAATKHEGTCIHSSQARDLLGEIYLDDIIEETRSRREVPAAYPRLICDTLW